MTNINKLIQDLTLKEKISLMSGFNSWYTNKIERLGVPSIKMSDGPNGVRGDSTSGKSSACFPCAISIGSTWDMDLINQLMKERRDAINSYGFDSKNYKKINTKFQKLLNKYNLIHTELTMGWKQNK